MAHGSQLTGHGSQLTAHSSQLAASAAAPALGHVRYIQRGLAVQPPHRQPGKGKLRESLFAAYGLQTKALQRASIGFIDGTLLHVDQRTDAVLRSASITVLRKGQIAEVVSPGTNHRVQTAAATATAIGSYFDVKSKGKVTTITVVEGAVLVSNSAGSVLVKTGQQTRVSPGQSPSAPVAVNSLAAIGWTGVIPAPASPVGLNVGLDANGGQVIASSSTRAPQAGQDYWNAAWIDDGRLDYGWASAAGQTTNQWVKVKLPAGKNHTIRAVVIDPAATHGQDAGNDVKDFQIRVSTTGSSDQDFTTVLSATAKQSNTLQRFDFGQPAPATYLEFVGLTNYGGPDGIDVAELEIVADEQVLAPPPAKHNLNGAWLDGGRRTVITQSGDAVDARYVKPYICDFRDGSGRTSQTTLDFRGTLDFNTIYGHTSICAYGKGNPSGVGLHLVPIRLTISADTRTIRGSWYNSSTHSNVPITITRLP
jgi:F5/8 type C domain/FecR protein